MQKLLVTTAIMACSVPGAAANLVTNGDFEAGNTGFTSGYTYVAPAPGAMFPETLYTVDTDAGASHPYWVSFGDHTSGSGNYLIVNGATTTGVTVWESGPIAVSSATNYFFETFAAEICCNVTYTGPNFPANLSFEIVDDLANVYTLGSFSTSGQTPGVWVGLSNLWNSGSASSVTLRILNSSIEFSGNDFAIDDINFSTSSKVIPGVPEPASWALMIVGLGLVGAAARRRLPLSA